MVWYGTLETMRFDIQLLLDSLLTCSVIPVSIMSPPSQMFMRNPQKYSNVKLISHILEQSR